jgi:hypothetical protein
MRAFVICRDRVTYARQCVDALLAVGLEVVIVDHGSTWPPMRDWLSGVRGVDVWYCSNRHPRDLWSTGGPVARWTGADERFIVTDCDVIPDPDCPPEWVGWMSVTLDRYPALRKVGLGLRTDDLPEHYEHRDAVRHWEAQYQAVEDGGRLGAVEDGRGVIADVDTTLAMYRRFEPFTLGPAMRLRPPYVARHLAWYEDSANPTPEQAYYREHAVHGHWRAPTTYADDYGLRG